MADEDYKGIVEAALFVAGKAMSADELATALGIASVGVVNAKLLELTKDYEARNGALALFKIGDKYILSVKEPYAGKVSGLAGAPDLTKGAMRILAYISRNEPVMQSSLVKTFGSSSYEYLKEIREKEFIEAAKSGRTKRLATTDKFKEYFNF